MRQLRLNRVARDTGELVLDSSDGLESFSVRVDDALRAAVHAVPSASTGSSSGRAGTGFGGAPASGPTAVPAHAADTTADKAVEVGPREIQVRVRAGESPQELAESLGASLDRVMRFAGPVLAERVRITDEARRGRARRADAESELVQFGEAVDDRFAAHGLVAAEVAWDSRRREDGDWIVVAEWDGGEGRHNAEWLFHRGTRTVTPLDDTAADLLSDRPIRPVVPPPPARPDLRAAPPLAPGVVAFPPMPDAHTSPLPRYEEVFDQDAVADMPSLSASLDLPFVEPPLPLAITDPTTRPAAAAPHLSPLASAGAHESEDDKADRARVPAWDDILLGIRRKD